MRKSLKRMVLTGAAVMVLVSGLSAPAMASPVGELKDASQDIKTPSGATSLPKSPNGPGSGSDFTSKLGDLSPEERASSTTPQYPIPVPAPTPGCGTPEQCKPADPGTGKPADPGTGKAPDPGTGKPADPGTDKEDKDNEDKDKEDKDKEDKDNEDKDKEDKDKEDKDKEDKDNEDPCPGLLERELCRDGNGNNTNNNNNNNSSSSSSSTSSSSDSSSSSSVINSYYYNGSYYDGILDRGGVFVSNFLPYEFTSVVEDAGYSLKSDLPSPVAETLPNTGGGWTFLALAGGALFLTGRFLIRRFSS